MIIHPEAKKSYDEQAFNMLQLMEQIPMNDNLQQHITGSMAHRASDNWTLKKTHLPFISSSANGVGEKMDIYEEYEGLKTGFSVANYPEFLKFTRKVYSNKSIQAAISYAFLENTVFEWLVDTYKRKQAQTGFTEFLTSMTSEALCTKRYRFEILNLDIGKSFMLGNVTFDYLTEDFFQEIKAKDHEGAAELIRMYSGKVFASCFIKNVESGRAEEIAYKECCKSVDILKLCSPTVAFPNYKTDFDIDLRVRVNDINKSIKTDINDKNLEMSLRSGAQSELFNSNRVDEIVNTSRNFAALITLQEPNELQNLIINSLSRFSQAISNHNVYKRIVDLLTIWESLLLKDSLTPIQDSVSLYASKLLKQTIEDRKDFISFFKRIYGIRSAVIHHAKEPELDMTDVARFQLETINLMETLIQVSKKHADKKSIIEEIDNAIHGAG